MKFSTAGFARFESIQMGISVELEPGMISLERTVLFRLHSGMECRMESKSEQTWTSHYTRSEVLYLEDTGKPSPHKKGKSSQLGL